MGAMNRKPGDVSESAQSSEVPQGNQDGATHKHFNGICEKEFDRGYAFGRRESYDEIMRLPNVAAKEGFTDDTVVIKIPREQYQKLQAEVERNL